MDVPEVIEAKQWWASMNTHEQLRWIEAAEPDRAGGARNADALDAYRAYQKAILLGCAYVISVRSKDLGGGYSLKLWKDSVEVGGGVFPANDEADIDAYYDAQATGADWINDQKRRESELAAEQHLFQQHMLEAGAVDLGEGSWQWEKPDFTFQLWRLARKSATESNDGPREMPFSQ